MTNIDEDKVKELLRGIVTDIFDCLPPNMYVDSEKASAMSRINEANLLTDQAPCATVKKTMTVQEAREFTGRAPSVPENPGYQ